ncbi:hypothetical protein [Moorena sp. SIO3E8]|uniref:hypothetical protein n=1 Tax=Moorena sp. SIO3E8 TaxID=2607830 RepID=UPI0013FF642E|nr:hypothetical protein [Moorena sp. SIO3E8]NEO14788.1 hypothetical protein [Moorena sp. SIO3E8]NEQ01186.1 hypothetical protein [Moorena sp. SIO3F7]
MGRWGDGERVSRFDLIAPTVVEFTYLQLLTTCNLKPATSNLQPVTCNFQPSTFTIVSAW